MRHTVVHHEVRDSILDSAERLIERYGYKKMTVDDIAKEAGIGKGTIYLHFRSKEDVALSYADRKNNLMQEHLRRLARRQCAPEEKLREMLVTRVRLRLETVVKNSVAIDELLAALRAKFMVRRETWRAGEAEIFAEVLLEGRLAGMFTFEDAMQTSQALLLATNGLLPISLSYQEITARDVVMGNAERIADILLKGLLKRPSDD